MFECELFKTMRGTQMNAMSIAKISNQARSHRDIWSTQRDVLVSSVYPYPPPTYNPTQPNHPLTLWVSSDDLELDLDRGCINICVNLSFFVVYEYLSWSGGGHEIFMSLADRSFRVFAEMWWLLVEQIKRRKRLYFICTTCGRYSVLGKYQMTVDIY